MVVGVCRLTLAIPETGSLKGKRSVVKKVIGRVRTQFHVAIAEVEDNDLWESAVLGIAVVANDHRFVNSVLDKVVKFVEETRLADVEDYTHEILHVL
jgi:uncharacterized protein YlxP (DUF503 family)